jgi:hypothetical protein
MISPTQGRYLHRMTQTQKKRGQTSMSRVGFGPTNPVFERPKRFVTLDPASTVIGCKEAKHSYPLHADLRLATENGFFGEFDVGSSY